MEFRNLFIEDPRGGGKVKVDMDLPHGPFDAGCLINCKGKEPLLALFVMSISEISADDCQQFFPDPMVHCNSGVCKHGASFLDMSKAFLPCRFAGEDTFT
jgi:hypothetical protein